MEIAKIFYDIANFLEIKGDNPFRIRSYRNAALTIETLPQNLETIIEIDENGLERIPGIGKGLHGKIVEIVNTGDCRFHGDILNEIPSGLLELLKLSGLGPKKVKLLYKELGITDLQGLEMAVREGRLKLLPGMGEKTEEKILQSIGNFKKYSERFKLATALSYAEPLINYIKDIEGVDTVSPAGSLRRRKETVGDIDILVICWSPFLVMEGLAKYREVKEIIAKGKTKLSMILRGGLQTDVRVMDKKSSGAALHYFTGSQNHNIVIRERAKKRGLKINEYGVFREDTGERIAGKTEEEIFKSVDLIFIPPELREDRGEIEAAEEKKLPALLNIQDIRGDLHMHTRASDGANTVDEMVCAAREMGYEYIAITEHSRAVTVAHGLDEQRLVKHIEDIDRINSKLKAQDSRFRVLKGVEVDIKPDGTLDLNDNFLSKLDIVIGAVHSRFNVDKEEMTKRLNTALSSGMIDILAHPTGRLIKEREPYPIDMENIMETARKYGIIMELNSYPSRLDINDIHCKMARDMGVKVVISTDSHSVLHLTNMRFGIFTARRGWLTREDVLNTRSYEELKTFLEKRKNPQA
ncbi:MAG: DNA polymerase/3'-5' exonuclease PolX [Thermodesulfobacteriota bacterium]